MPISTYPIPPLTDIGGTGPRDLWAVGEEGSTHHYDGTTWTTWPSGTSLKLNAVTTPATGGAVAVGEEGTILRFATDHWEPQRSGTTRRLLDVWSASTGEVWVAGSMGEIGANAGSAAILHRAP
jgi:hypothetical protein